MSENVEISRDLCRAYVVFSNHYRKNTILEQHNHSNTTGTTTLRWVKARKNLSMRIKIRRRMTKILEPILGSLNPEMCISRRIVLAFELAEACVSLQMMKETQLKRTNSAKPDSIARARKYAQDAAKYFELFCELVEKEGRGEINEDRVVSYVRAKLHGARMIMKQILHAVGDLLPPSWDPP